MKSLFDKTQEELQAWLKRQPDEPACGLLAVSPEIYEEMLKTSAEHLLGIDRSKNSV